MKGRSRRDIKVVKHARRNVKITKIPVIKWVRNDNLCLLYAIWETSSTEQKLLLSVRQYIDALFSKMFSRIVI